jgi:hypothetical protein
MAKPLVPVFVKSVTWNSNTWDANGGGLQSVDLDIGGEPLEHHSGDDIYARFQAIVRKRCEINVGVDYVSPATVEGAVASLVFILKMADLTTLKTVTCTKMKLARISLNQSEGVAGGTRLRFIHESDNGQDEPITVA